MTTQIIEIVKYPNEILRQKSTPISAKDEDFKDVMDKLNFAKEYVSNNENQAAGLALPQIGVLKRGFVATLGGKTEIVINPKILKKSGIDYDTEGCLSIEEEILGEVPRPKSIMVQYVNDSMKVRVKTLTGWDARVFCHELDHLNGVLFFDHIKED